MWNTCALVCLNAFHKARLYSIHIWPVSLSSLVTTSEENSKDVVAIVSNS